MESNPYLVGDEPTQEVEDEVSPLEISMYILGAYLGTLNSCGSMAVCSE